MRLLTRIATLVAVLGSAAGCGGDDDGRARGSCPELDPDEPVTITLPWGGDPAFIESWDASVPAVEVELTSPQDGPVAAMRQLLDDEAPTVTVAADWIVPLLGETRLIRPLDVCLDGSAAQSVVGWVMLYDRAAFRRAGLDPDQPPATIADLHDAAIALRSAGLTTPISWSPVPVALWGHAIGTVEAKRAAEAWARLGTDGLLHERTEEDDFPPLGSGEVAVQIGTSVEVWDYANALAEGQAPESDIGVAPIPQLAGAVSPIESLRWVVSADASDEQVAAVAELVRWWRGTDRQLQLHRDYGLLPADPAQARSDGFEQHWEGRPLLAAAWRAMHVNPAPESETDLLVGGWATINLYLRDVAFGGADFEERWLELVDAFEHGAAVQADDPARLVRCVANPDAPRRLDECLP